MPASPSGMVNSVLVGLSFVLSDATVPKQPKVVHGTRFSDSVGRGGKASVSLVTVTSYDRHLLAARARVLERTQLQAHLIRVHALFSLCPQLLKENWVPRQ